MVEIAHMMHLPIFQGGENASMRVCSNNNRTVHTYIIPGNAADMIVLVPHYLSECQNRDKEPIETLSLLRNLYCMVETSRYDLHIIILH